MKKILLLLLFIPFVSFGQNFCDGWNKGYKKGLDSCMKIGVTPLCPTPKAFADTYGDGYGLGYKKAKENCNDEGSFQNYELPRFDGNYGSNSSAAYTNPNVVNPTVVTDNSGAIFANAAPTVIIANKNNVNIDYVKKLSLINKNWIVGRKWTLERGVEYQVIIDRFIDAENNTIFVDLAKMSLTTVEMIVQHKDTRTRFIFRNFKTGENNKITNYNGGIRSYDWFMIKKGKWRKWMEKYGKKNIADYLENSISKSDDDW